jgi:hypothetical protein
VDDVLALLSRLAQRATLGVKNLFILAFQTSWCRGGKGERKLACSSSQCSTSADTARPCWLRISQSQSDELSLLSVTGRTCRRCCSSASTQKLTTRPCATRCGACLLASSRRTQSAYRLQPSSPGRRAGSTVGVSRRTGRSVGCCTLACRGRRRGG